MSQINASQAPSLAGKHIIIAGAGIAGLAFARALDRKWPLKASKPRITLYERRERAVSKDREGYSISIRSDAMSGGMQALQDIGLLDDALAASITGQHGGGGKFTIWDASWKPILSFKQSNAPPDGLPVHSMRISRAVLKEHLLDGLPLDVRAHWKVACESASILENGRVQVTLSNGTTDECDFLVAADGANSKVREALRPKDGLQYAGATAIAATARFPNGLPTVIEEDYGVVIGGLGSSVFASPIDDHSAVWSISVVEPQPREARHARDEDDKDSMLREALKMGSSIAQPFRTLVEATDPITLMAFNAMDKQPIDHSQMDQMPVVFLGDANHAVSPFAGNGANMALMDGVDLAVELSKPQDIRSSIAAFDGKSRSRSKRTIDVSHMTISIAHATGWRLTLWTVLLRLINFFVFR